MPLDQAALLLIAVLLAAWTIAAGAAIVSARVRLRQAEVGRRNARRLARMIEESPAIPLLVRTDGRIEAPQRLAGWLGLDAVPQFLSELDAGERGIDAAQLAAFGDAVRRTQKTAAPLRMELTPRGARRSLALRGHLADPQVSPGGAALVWVFDFGDSDDELVQLRHDLERTHEDRSALLAMIEAAPVPMWIRRGDGALRLANAAYAAAVGTTDSAEAVAGGVELVEPVEGSSPAEVALEAAREGKPHERQVAVTIDGQRRSLRVTDLPLGNRGIAGYAVDIEEVEELARTFRAFREAQRSILDSLSAGIAQFDAGRQLVFVNRPFQQIFGLDPGALAEAPFDRVLAMARDAGRLPEVRDFAEWRRDKARWFLVGEAHEEEWPLSGGTHLRIVAQPEPDGGLLLIVEDRSEQLRLAAIRDTLLRTRAATFDSLSESVAVFAPDRRMQLWNRRFVADWSLETELLDTHPRIEAVLERIGARLKVPAAATAIGDVVRAATLDRTGTRGRAELADGRTLAYAGVPLPDGNGLLTMLDITDSQKAENALRERNAALQAADAVKARFLAELGDEFRMPHQIIGGFAERLHDGLGGELNEFGKDYVTAILASVDRIGEHIDKLLEISRTEAGVVPDTSEEVELAAFARRLAEERRAQIREAGLTLDLRCDRSAGSFSADRQRLERAIGNLLDNAIAATPNGGRILFDVAPHVGPDGPRARIVVSDNGPGMDEAALDRAIRGIRLLDDGTAVPGDPASGLPLTRELVEAIGGSFELLSEPGHGTAAIVELP